MYEFISGDNTSVLGGDFNPTLFISSDEIKGSHH